MSQSEAARELVPVRILQLPIDVHRRSSAHFDTLRRELALLESAGPGSVPVRLQALSAELTEMFSGFTLNQDRQLEAAITAGEASVDLEYQVPTAAADGAERIAELLDEVDEFCAAGDLLTLVTPPEALGYRRWFLCELVDQIRSGRPPRPWSPRESPLEGRAAQPSSAPPLIIAVAGDLDLDGASRLRGPITAHIEKGDVRLVLDLVECDFIDSVGLSLLLTSRARCLEKGGSLTLINADESVLSTLGYSGIAELFIS